MVKSYASYFVSYLLNNLKSDSNINKVILFGSVAKDESTKESDIDIFIDVNKKKKTFEAEIKKILKNFYESREALIFKSRGINNKINLIIGRLNEWKDLKISIESTGIILYGKYQGRGIGEKKHAIIFWDKIKKNRGAFLNKVYGFKVKSKKYPGLIEQFNGKKIGKSAIIIPVEHASELERLIKKYKVQAKILDIYV